MDGIKHRMVEVNGIAMHVAEKGEGPAVLLVHGFPELWYSWRHQILGLSAAGYRAIAPDLRGYGDTSAPPDVASYTVFHIVGDLIALLDALGVSQVFLVGHDWGALVAWYMCTFRPDRVKSLVILSISYWRRHPTVSTVQSFKNLYGDDYYICLFQEPGAVEAEFASVGTKLLFRNIFTARNPGPSALNRESLYNLYSTDKQLPLPTWLTEEDINYYATKFDKCGFTGGLNYYRCLDLDWELTAPWSGKQIEVPTKYIVGDLDLTYNYPGIQDYIHKGGFKEDVPLLQEVVVMEGVAHYLQQEKALEVTEHIIDFINKFSNGVYDRNWSEPGSY